MKVDFTLIEKPPEKSLIQQLEYLMEKAKTGELQELVFVCSYRGNFVNHGWSKLQNQKRRRIVGEMEVMKIELLK